MCTCPRRRSRPTQTKSKKESKLELFGFDDADAHQEDSSADNMDGGSSYKIKYFGFDDMSDSDGADDDDDDGSKERRRRAKKAAAAKGKPVVTAVEEIQEDEDEDDDEPPDPFERLEIPEIQEFQGRPAAKENKKYSERQESRIRAG